MPDLVSENFPPTRVSAVAALRTGTEEERRESLGRLLEVYYRPIYKHLRCKWRKTPEAAEDLAQDFFTKAVERGILGLYDPERGRVVYEPVSIEPRVLVPRVIRKDNRYLESQ
jgi:hypothetical protein